MKSLKIFIIAILMLLIILPVQVFAAGSITPSPRSLTINKGATKTFKVTASNACGRVDISSSNSSVAKVNVSSQWLENNSVTVTVTGVSAGTANITVRLTDAATFDEEALSGSYTVSVTVKDPQASSSPNNNTGSNNSTGTSVDKNLSTNNKIKELSVEGYTLKSAGNNAYELIVNNDVSSINIIGKAEDSKATVSGTGKKELSVGANKFTVTVKSESGSKKNYTINVTRRDGFYLEDINTLLNDSNKENNTVIIKKDDIVSSDVVNKIKQSKQNAVFNYYNESKKLIYSWNIDGTSIDDINGFKTKLSFNSKNVEKIGELSNYADGYYLNFEHTGNLPKGTKVKVYVGDKFTDNSKVNIYHFTEEGNNLDLIEKDNVVKDGYIEFEIEHCSEYFVTRSTIQNNVAVETKEQTNVNIYMIIALIEIVVIIGLIIYCFKTSKSKE